MPLLSVRKLNKRFGQKSVLKNLCFQVNQSEIVGLLGPNGVGKSTAMKCICGLVHYDSGDISIEGHDINADRVSALKLLGASIESPALYLELTGAEHIRLMAQWRDLPKTKIAEAEAFSKLGEALHRRTSSYSTGMKMRLILTMVLMPKPHLIILDEPMNGLDPEGVIQLREELCHLKDQGTGILLSSHLLSELEKICDRVLMINHGAVIFDGAISDKQMSSGYDIYTNELPRLEAILKERGYICAAKTDSQRTKCLHCVATEGELNDLLMVIVNEGIRLSDLKKAYKSLEDIYQEVIVSN